MINIKIRKDRLADVLLDGYNDSDIITVGVGTAFNPCVFDDEGYLVISSSDDCASSELKITIGELGTEVVIDLALALMKKLRGDGDKDKMGSFLRQMIEAFVGFTHQDANELIVKILEMVE